MANVTPTVQVMEGEMATVKVTWANMLNGDIGLPVTNIHSMYVDRSIQVEGTFGAGGSVSLKGRNGTAYSVLRDKFNGLLTFTAADLKTVNDVPADTRPEVTAGDGTTSLTVTLLMKVDNMLRQ